ncbi:MAG: BlaI/MecI/CopY family transcriptional regulator [Cyclobacteriaceae bacterium]
MNKKYEPTETELAILKILWQDGPNTVKAVHQHLSKQKKSGYTTTLKLMQIMHTKGLVTRDESERQHVYAAAIEENRVKQGFIHKMMQNLYEGSASQMIMQILGSQQTSRQELEEIKHFINKMEEGQQNGK